MTSTECPICSGECPRCAVALRETSHIEGSTCPTCHTHYGPKTHKHETSGFARIVRRIRRQPTSDHIHTWSHTEATGPNTGYVRIDDDIPQGSAEHE